MHSVKYNFLLKVVKLYSFVTFPPLHKVPLRHPKNSIFNNGVIEF